MTQLQPINSYLIQSLIDCTWPPLTKTQPLHDRSITLVPSMYNFIFMNVARLITLTKRKSEILSDLCDKSTLFLCLCETF